MRIGIDARAYGWAGLGRYTRNLLYGITSSSAAAAHDLVVFAPRAWARELSALPRTRVVPVTSSYYSLQEQTVFLHSLMRERLDVMHFPHFNAPMLYRRPFVVTIHDLTRFLFPAQKKKSILHQWVYEEVFRAAVVGAQRIIAVSQHTQRDLQRFFPAAAMRSVVIPEGIEHAQYHARPAAREHERLAELGIHKPYLLYVGVWMNHKNLRRLLEAFRFVRAQGYPHTLVVTGQGRTQDENVPRMVHELGLTEHVRLPGIVAEDTLPALYRHADTYVFPSLYEGFGFTPLEAMACGTPVVASNVACMPEILGDAAVYVDPFSPEDIARGIIETLIDPMRRAALADAGRAWAQQYVWDTCAVHTLHVYEEVARAHSVRV